MSSGGSRGIVLGGADMDGRLEFRLPWFHHPVDGGGWRVETTRAAEAGGGVLVGVFESEAVASYVVLLHNLMLLHPDLVTDGNPVLSGSPEMVELLAGTYGGDPRPGTTNPPEWCTDSDR
jgi:hypothetical protein